MKTSSLGKGERASGRKGAFHSLSLIRPFSVSPFRFETSNPLNIRWVVLFLATVLGLTTTGCAYYSFSGATIPSRLNSIAIPLAVDNTISPVSSLDQNLTQLLTDRFVGQTRLQLQTNEQEADALLTTRIQSYENQPTAVSGDERATRNRVTIRVAATYYDQVEDRALLEQTFSSFGEYDPADGLDGERAAAQTALENIADNIFTDATSNW